MAEPNLKLITKTKGSGRTKQPIEKRRILSDNPHKNRISPPDIPMGTTLELGPIPEKPPVEMSKYEIECWDRIAETQIALKNSAWIYRSDCAYIIACCVMYGRLMEVRDEINEIRDKGLPFLSDGKANPLLTVEANLASKYMASLSALGLVPTKRQLTAAPENESSDDGLLS